MKRTYERRVVDEHICRWHRRLKDVLASVSVSITLDKEEELQEWADDVLFAEDIIITSSESLCLHKMIDIARSVLDVNSQHALNLFIRHTKAVRAAKLFPNPENQQDVVVWCPSKLLIPSYTELPIETVLPAEIWLEIARWVDVENELKLFAQTCRYLHDLISSEVRRARNPLYYQRLRPRAKFILKLGETVQLEEMKQLFLDKIIQFTIVSRRPHYEYHLSPKVFLDGKFVVRSVSTGSTNKYKNEDFYYFLKVLPASVDTGARSVEERIQGVVALPMSNVSGQVCFLPFFKQVPHEKYGRLFSPISCVECVAEDGK